MLLNKKKSNANNALVLTLITSAGIILVANMFGEDTSKYVGDFMYIPITLGLVIFSYYNFKQYKRIGKHGIAWTFFFFGTLSWFIAEMTWIFYELVLKDDPFPSPADIFYLAGYPLMIIFMAYYLKPLKKAITRKILIASTTVAILALVPTIYFTISNDLDSDEYIVDEIALISYPCLDAVILAPAIIGIILFFRGEVNFSWTLIVLGIVMMIVGDTGFYFTDITGEYYTGHPIEIAFYWAYLLLVFGVYNHLLIFKTPDTASNSDKKITKR